MCAGVPTSNSVRRAATASVVSNRSGMIGCDARDSITTVPVRSNSHLPAYRLPTRRPNPGAEARTSPYTNAVYARRCRSARRQVEAGR